MGADPVSVLMVDDRQENLVAMEAVLARPDRRLLAATSGNDALRLLLRNDIAVALLDVQMPGMDGYEIARLMRGEARTRDVPIIFVTAGDHSDDRVFQGYEAGAVDFLYKPVNAVALESKVEVFIQLYRNAAQLRTLNAALEKTSSRLQERIIDLENVNRTLLHDLRAPLRSIDGFSRILVDSCRAQLDDQAVGYLDRISKACHRMGRMLEDLHHLLRVSGTDESFSETDCERVLRDVLEDLRADLSATATEVTHDPLPAIHANATLVALVLQNLIGNAIKFGGSEPPRIHVAAERDGRQWRFSVRDNGIGIAPEHLQKVFGVFKRAVSEAIPGTGVGLALCKQSVEKHGGTIWVESTPGAGSTFYFTMPVDQRTSRAQRSETS
jgi:two-component system, sensor histidine kinase and response regulator